MARMGREPPREPGLLRMQIKCRAPRKKDPTVPCARIVGSWPYPMHIVRYGKFTDKDIDWTRNIWTQCRCGACYEIAHGKDEAA